MAIRLRTVAGVRVALCAVESDPKPGDVYLDDGDHYALAAKFSRDWDGRVAGWPYPVEWAAMDTQKVRDAKEELEKWLAESGGKVGPDFGSVEGVPTGGYQFAEALGKYTSHGPLLIAEDVVTTGRSIERQRAGRSAIGICVFARQPVPGWVKAIFKMSEPQPNIGAKAND